VADGLVLTRRESERGVHETAQRAGGGASADLVRHYVGYEEWAGACFYRREMARRGVALILGFGDAMEVFDAELDSPVRTMGAFVVGSQLRPSLTGIGGHQLGVQVELSPGGALALFGDVAQFNDVAVPLDETLGDRGGRLVEQLADARSWDERLAVLDETLGSVSPHSLSPEVAWLAHQLVASQGRAKVEPLMDETGWSRRHVTERFRRQFGLPPKAYARLLRFERATALLSAPDRGRTLADVAMDAGYYDQSHLARDFATLAGITPRTYVADAAAVPEVRFVQDGDPAVPA
jgi:AraC-like DNA-binding protein